MSKVKHNLNIILEKIKFSEQELIPDTFMKIDISMTIYSKTLNVNDQAATVNASARNVNVHILCLIFTFSN